MKLLLLSISVLTFSSCDQLFSPETNITRCVNKIIGKFVHPESLIYIVDTNLQVPYPVVYQDSSKNWLRIFKFQIPDIYVINLESDINRTLEFLSKFENFNSRAKFIILEKNSTAVEKTFLQLSKYFIYNAVIIQPGGLLSTYNPYIHEDATPRNVEPVLLGHCLAINATNLFVSKLPTLWHNTTIRSIYFNLFPLLYSTNGRLYGAGYEKLKLIQHMLKFRLSDKLSEKGPFDLSKTNGTYDSMLGLLQRREEDLMLNNFMLLSEKQALEFDVASLNVAIYQHWVVPKAQLLPQWKVFCLTFSGVIWMLILLSLLVISSLWCYLEKGDFTSSLELQYQVLLEASNSKILKVKRVPSRILACVSVFSFCVISTAFKREMMRTFSSYSYEDQIKSLEDLVKREVPCYLYNENKELYKYSDHFYRNYIHNICVTIPPNTDIEEYFAGIASGRNFATIVTRTVYKYLKNKMQIKDVHQEPLVYLVPNEVKYEYAYIFLTKGYPLHHRFLEAAGKLVASGLTQLFERQHYYSIESQLKSKEVKHSENLTFEEILMALYILIAGLSVSAGVFSVEAIFDSLKNGRSRIFLWHKSEKV